MKASSRPRRRARSLRTTSFDRRTRIEYLEQRTLLDGDPALSLVIDADSIVESAGVSAATATVTRLNTDNSQALTVRITSGDTTEAVVPATVMIPANQASTAFAIDAVNDDLHDGPQTVTISVSASLSDEITPDAGFGVGGSVSLSDSTQAVAVQPDGRIVTAGYYYTGSNPNYYDFAVRRFHANGTPDTSFGGTGLVLTDISGEGDRPYAVVIQADGKIVVGGTGYNGPQFDMMMARYNTDGTLDTSFGTGGKVIVDYPGSYNELWDMAIQPDGKILAAGNINGFGVHRFNTDGTLDASFGTGGRATTTGGRAFGVALQPDGKIIVAGEEDGGNASAKFLLARFTASGSLDTSFGATGRVSTDVPGSYENAYDVTVQPDGKIIAVGGVSPVGVFPPMYDLAAVRYQPNGSLDTSFGTSGITITDFGGFDRARSVDLQPDSEILMAGGALGDEWPTNHILVARYHANGTLDTSMISSDLDVGEAFAIQPDGRVVVAAWRAFDGQVSRYDAFIPLAASDSVVVEDDEFVVSDDAYAVDEDATLAVPAPGVLGNDNELGGSGLTATLVSAAVNGLVTLNADGSFTYVPALNFNGTDEFTYRALAGSAVSNVATVAILINPMPDAPTAANDFLRVNKNSTLAVNAPGVLANDVDVDGDALTAALVSDPPNGVLTLNADGSLTYTPNADFDGSDSFTYQAEDASSASDPATVTITINDPPISADDSFTVDEDGTLFIPASGVLENDSDPEGDIFTAVLVAGPASGTLIFTGDGSFTYIPDDNFNGADSFSYKANDGLAEGNIAAVTITINPVDELPAGVPVLVKDINTDTASAFGSLQNVGGSLYLIATDGNTGTELWTSDGTAAGTSLIKDITTGENGSAIGPIIDINGTLYFSANNLVNGLELWKSDRTPGGTVMVKDIRSGSSSSSPVSLTNFNGMLYFVASDGVAGFELWKSDGTEAGTVMVIDLYAGSISSNPTSLTVMNGTLYFFAASASTGTELWRSDGTAAGTVLVKDIGLGSTGSSPALLTNVNGVLYFRATDFFAVDPHTTGPELWKSDGTYAGTVLVKDINPASAAGSSPTNFRNVGGTLFFTASDGVTGTELWRSDGTAAGTVLVKDIFPGITGSTVASPTVSGGVLYFSANDGTHGDELWRSDGTDIGTYLVKDIGPGATATSLSWLTDADGTLYFRALEPTSGAELWRSDGTESGTSLVADIVQGANSGSPSNLGFFNGEVYFLAFDSRLGWELWKSDGTAMGTALVTDLNRDTNSAIPSGSSFDHRSFYAQRDGILYFPAYDGAGYPLWKNDGTKAGTQIVKQLTPGIDVSSFYGPLVNINGTIFFSASDGVGGYELWKSNGTTAGTVMVKDIAPGSTSSFPSSLTAVGNTLFFIAADGVSGRELWKSDGTAAGTVMLKDILAGGPSSNPASLTAVGSVLFFSANDGAVGTELWKSNGTAAGTVLVKDLNSGSNSSAPSDFVDVNGTLYFHATGSGVGDELFKSDGTAAGTVLVKDINAGSNGASLDHLVNAAGILFFQATLSSTGAELWKSDGTAAGTVLVKDIQPGSAGSFPMYPLAIGNVIYFQANDGVAGRELWISDGTDAGTQLVKDLFPGTTDSIPDDFAVFNGVLFFDARASVGGVDIGRELWHTDGTAAGTVLVLDINPGVSNSLLTDLTVVGNTLFMGATDGRTGTELRQLVFHTPTADGGGPYSVTEGGTVTLDASGSIDPDQSTASLVFTWDLDRDGIYGETGAAANGNENGMQPTFVAAGVDGPGSIAVGLLVTDNTNLFSIDTAAINIDNTPPTLTISGSSSVDEGATYSLSLLSSDPGSDTITSWEIVWGDGAVDTVSGNPSSVPHTYADGQHDYTISATATDEDGTFSANSKAITVNNVAPTLTIGGANSVDEGASYTLSLSSSDPGADTISGWTIDWGDGNVQNVTGNPSSATHVFADGPNSYTITAMATDEDGTFTANSKAITVNNVAPNLTISGANAVDEAATYALNLSSSDPGSDTIFGWTINWGDGNVQSLTGNPSSVTHVFADGPSSYTIAATATDEDGMFSANSKAITVNNVAPTLTISGANAVDEAATYTLNLSSNDPGIDTISGWTIDWGDGSIQNVSGNPSSVTHGFADGPNSYTITATATDEDGTFNANSKAITVNNVAPTLTISGANSVDEGATYTLNLSSSDPGADSITGWTITWGDGAVQNVTGNPSSVAHVFADGPNSYTITATATDEDGTFDANAKAVTVNNVAPTLTISGASSVNEGSVFTLNLSSSDPGTDTIASWSIAWGDGMTTNVSGNPASVTHVYADGPQNVTVSAIATDEDGTFGSNTVSVSVSNVAPSAGAIGSPSPANPVRGQSVGLSASFTDPGSGDTHEVSWSFGDGTSIPFHPSTDAGALTPAHVYAATGTFTVTFTVRDDDGAVSSSTRSIVVAAAVLQDDPAIVGQKALVVGGTTGNDTFSFRTRPGNKIEVTINGAAQGQFSFNGRIIVFAQAGNDTVSVGVPRNGDLHGDGGNDTLTGGDGPDSLFGGTGADSLVGGRGRDLLIGGTGADRINSKDGDDLLVAGTSSYDDNSAAIIAIMQEWARTDQTYAQRIDHLFNGGGLNGSVLLNLSSAFDDAAVDTLTGGTGLDWFLAELDGAFRDTIIDLAANEQTLNL